MKRIINKSISIIISLSVIFVLLGSTVFIVRHTNHHCTEKSCTVCAELANCRNNILNLGSAGGIGSYLIVFAIGCIAYIFYALFSVSNNNTLISLKVELLN